MDEKLLNFNMQMQRDEYPRGISLPPSPAFAYFRTPETVNLPRNETQNTSPVSVKSKGNGVRQVETERYRQLSTRSALNRQNWSMERGLPIKLRRVLVLGTLNVFLLLWFSTEQKGA